MNKDNLKCWKCLCNLPNCWRNVIHCDIKHSNINFGEDGLIKIGDFSVSKLLTYGISTPKFMAPEIIDENKEYDDIKTNFTHFIKFEKFSLLNLWLKLNNKQWQKYIL